MLKKGPETISFSMQVPFRITMGFALLAVATARPNEDSSAPKKGLEQHLHKLVSGPYGAKMNNGVYRLQVEGPKQGVYTIIIDQGKVVL